MSKIKVGDKEIQTRGKTVFDIMLESFENVNLNISEFEMLEKNTNNYISQKSPKQ